MNSVILFGHLTSDPEFVGYGDGRKLFILYVLTRERGTHMGEAEVSSHCHRVILYGNAKAFNQVQINAREGSQVLIEGRLVSRSYTAEGQTHLVSEVIVGPNDNLELIDTTFSSLSQFPSRPSSQNNISRPSANSIHSLTQLRTMP